jgi:hypothetical protein
LRLSNGFVQGDDQNIGDLPRDEVREIECVFYQQ